MELIESMPLAALPHVDGQFINVAGQSDALAEVRRSTRAAQPFTFFTLNLDHLVKLRADPVFRAAYRGATFVCADGWPVALLARRSGRSVARTTGADLLLPLCEAAAADGHPVFLFGSTDESLARAEAVLRQRVPGLEIRGRYAPPFGFDPQSPLADEVADRIAASGARVVFVALGAPKQELFAARAAARHRGLGLICVGAALDFLSGTQVRAPRAFQRLGLEWFWRLAHDPRHLGQRYARCLWLLVELLAEEAMARILPSQRASRG